MSTLESIREDEETCGGDNETFVPFESEKSASSGISCAEIGGVELEWFEHIGTGHTCDVFRGMYNGSEVAIKQFRGKCSTNDESLAREIAVMCLVTHPNIVLLHGVVTEESPLKIVMEYCRGGSCFELLHHRKATKPTWSQVLRMSMHIAVAMDYLHRFSPCIIHRDLKSLNILLDKPLTGARDLPLLKVADFGLARMLDGQNSEPLTLGVGTNQWMAPEIVCGSRYDEKVDVYSFAMVLYEMTCQKIPFLKEPPMELRRLVLGGARPDLSYMPSQSSSCFKDLIQTCWSGDPKKRPAFGKVVQIISDATSRSVILSL